MGNRVYASKLGSISLLFIVIALVFLQPQYADAASRSAQLKKRLCDRQEILGSRLARALINPALCESAPTPQPTLTFTATPSTIDEGESSTLAWSTTNATSCTASNGWSGSKDTSGTQSVTPSNTTTYTLTCNGVGGNVSKSVTVTVEEEPVPAPSLTFTANPTSVFPNATSTLTWSSSNATACVASNGWSGTKSLSGSEAVNPSATTTYTLACGNGNSTSTQNVTVNVTPFSEPTVMLFANPLSVSPGEGTATTTLTWSSTNATSCTASGSKWTGSKALSGSEVVTPTATTTYQLSCTGPGGTATDDVTVNFVPSPTLTPTLSLVANPTSVTPGAGSATSTLTWDSANASACIASNGWSGSKSVDGSEIVQPNATTTYTLDCGNGTATTTQSVSVNFVPAASSTPNPTLSFSATPTSVSPGAGSATSTLTWVSANASMCMASNGWTGEKDLNGSAIVEPSATTTYALLCGNGTSSSTASVTIDFVPAASTPIAGHILISEVFDEPEDEGQHGADSANEWIELYNPTNATVDLSNWTIIDLTTNFDRIPQGTTIPAGGFLILTNASTTPGFWGGMNGVQVIAFGSPLGSALNNSNEALFLRNAATTTIDSLSWGTNTTGFISGSGAADVIPGHSLARSVLNVDSGTSADWFDDATPSPGLAN